MGRREKIGLYAVSAAIFAGLFGVRLYDYIAHHEFYGEGFQLPVRVALLLGISFFGMCFFFFKLLRTLKETD